MSFVQKQIGKGDAFGSDLRELRELRGHSLDELSRLTNIHPSILGALEDERLGDLVDPRYAERHVRAIVLALDGRPAYFLKKYRDLLERRHIGLPEGRLEVVQRTRRRDFFLISQAVALGGFFFLVVLAVAYLIWQGRSVQNAPPLTIDTPPEGLQLSVPHVDVRGDTDPAARVTVNGRPAVVDRDGHFFLSFDVPRGLTTLSIEARRRFGASVVQTRRVSYVPIGNQESSSMLDDLGESITSSTSPGDVTSISSTQTPPL